MVRTLTGLLAAALVLPATVFAQETTRTYTERERTVYTEEDTHKRSIGIMAGVGVSDYNRDLNRVVDPGVGYGARVDLSPLRNVGLELGYSGAVNEIDESLSADGRLITNAVGGNLRLNLVPPDRELPANLRPFVFGGAFYHRIDTDNFVPGIEDNINAFALPFGAGVEAEIANRFLIGGRFTYNKLYNVDEEFGGRNSDNWAATVNLGTRLGMGGRR